jgi:hypothetical protein
MFYISTPLYIMEYRGKGKEVFIDKYGKEDGVNICAG